MVAVAIFRVIILNRQTERVFMNHRLHQTTALWIALICLLSGQVIAAPTEQDHTLEAQGIKSYIVETLMSETVALNIRELYLPLAKRVVAISKNTRLSAPEKQKALFAISRLINKSIQNQSGQTGYYLLAPWIRSQMRDFNAAIVQRNFIKTGQMGAQAVAFLTSLVE